ncbi:hypothetical protein TNCV_3841921 [Trichonephila clavipes]|nr:hypothetical protein TNCV_3841921 [Trichonephila clavipes]
MTSTPESNLVKAWDDVSIANPVLSWKELISSTFILHFNRSVEKNSFRRRHRSGHVFSLQRQTGSDVVQSGRPIFDDFFQHLWPYIGNNKANVVFQMVKRLWLIRIDQ